MLNRPASVNPKIRLILLLVGVGLLASACKPSAESNQFYPLAGNLPECDVPARKSFQEAFANLEFDQAVLLGQSVDEKSLGKFGEEVVLGLDDEFSGFNIPRSISDSLVQDQWNELLQAKAWQMDDFAQLERLVNLDLEASPGDKVLPSAFAKANGLQKFNFDKESFTLPLERSAGSNPMVEVKLNGKKYKFWIDTGAAATVLSSEVAEKVGLKYLTDQEAEIGTSTRKTVQSQPGLIDSIRIGALQVDNHPCIVLNKKDLIFRFLGIRLVKIDGIIGWPLIKELDMEFNLPENELTIRKPGKLGSNEANLGWYWQPFLQVQSGSGCDLNLQLDTGSGSTFFRPGAYQKLGQNPKRGGPVVMGGAGGKEVVRFDKLDSCRFTLGEHEVLMKYAEGMKKPGGEKELFQFDGVLGQDILKHGILRLDFQNRRFEFQIPDQASGSD